MVVNINSGFHIMFWWPPPFSPHLHTRTHTHTHTHINGLIGKRVRRPATQVLKARQHCRYIRKMDLMWSQRHGMGNQSVSQRRWHDPKCIISHWFETQREWLDAWTFTQENQQDWVTDWMDVIAGERGAQKPSSDRKEESQLDFKISGTRVYENMGDNVLIVSKF